MPVDPTRIILHSLGRAAQNERAKGNESGAAGLALIAFGIFTLPVPIIGIPLIVMGIYKMCNKDS